MRRIWQPKMRERARRELERLLKCNCRNPDWATHLGSCPRWYLDELLDVVMAYWSFGYNSGYACGYDDGKEVD